MKKNLANKNDSFPLKYSSRLKCLVTIVFLWFFVYFTQISNFMLSNLKESYSFEMVALLHSLLFVLLVVLLSFRSHGSSALMLYTQVIAAGFLIVFYTYGYQTVSSTYFVPNASDALLYNDFAISSNKDGFLVTVKAFLGGHGVADLGASAYVYLVYLILPESPVSVYFVNLLCAIGLIFILKLNAESKFFKVLRLTLLVNPFLFFLIVTSFKELPMICVLLLALKFFLQKKMFKSTLFFLILFFFRPAISALFLAAILLNIVINNVYLFTSKFRLNFKVLYIIPIVFVFIISFPLLLNFLQSGLLATLDYYKGNDALSSYSIPVAFLASFFTGFLGPLYKPYTSGEFSLSVLYSFFFPVCLILNSFCFFYIQKRIKKINDLQVIVFIFILLGLLSISVMLRGFDLRYTLVFYIVLWWLSASTYSGLTLNQNQNRIN